MNILSTQIENTHKMCKVIDLELYTINVRGGGSLTQQLYSSILFLNREGILMYSTNYIPQTILKIKPEKGPKEAYCQCSHNI